MAINDPTLYYTMDTADISGSTITDRGSQGANGTLAGSPTTGVTGKIKQAITFDGSTQGILATAFTYGTDTTIAAWCKPANNTMANNWMVTVGSENIAGWGAGISVFSGSWIFATVINGAVQSVSGTATVTGQYDHVVGIRQGTTISIYVNGSFVGSNTCPSNPLRGGTCASVGYRDGVGNYFAGDIDEARIYGRALSSAEVAALYAYTGASKLLEARRKAVA